jgi:glycosyltransferase involved in cell wall biosynthesis
MRHLVLPAIKRSEVNPTPLKPVPFGEHFDLIHVYQLQTVVASMLAVWCRVRGTPLVVTDLGGGGRSPMRRWRLHRWIQNGLAISEHSRRLMPEELRPRTTVVRGGVDTVRFGYTDQPRARQVVQVGRIMPHKGINHLIDAADGDFDVIVAGRVVDGRYFDLLRSMSEGKRVRFLLDPTDDQIRDLYRRSGVTVAASVYEDVYGFHYPQSELLGLTLLESMAVGTPVVCTAVGGMPEYVEDGKTGFIVPPGDSGWLGQRIRQLLDGPTLAGRMGTAGHEAVQKYGWEHVAAEFNAQYEQITARHAVPN